MNAFLVIMWSTYFGRTSNVLLTFDQYSYWIKTKYRYCVLMFASAQNLHFFATFGLEASF